jgi:hypothetical protein
MISSSLFGHPSRSCFITCFVARSSERPPARIEDKKARRRPGKAVEDVFAPRTQLAVLAADRSRKRL